MYGLVIAQSFVSAPFLVVVARSAFRAVDPSLGRRRRHARPRSAGPVPPCRGAGRGRRYPDRDDPHVAAGLRGVRHDRGPCLPPLQPPGLRRQSVLLRAAVARPRRRQSSPSASPHLASSSAASRRPARVRRRPIPAPLAPCRRRRRRWASTSTPPSGRSICGWLTQRAASAWRWSGRRDRASRVTLRALAGLLGPGAGTVTYGGVDVSGVRTRAARDSATSLRASA